MRNLLNRLKKWRRLKIGLKILLVKTFLLIVITKVALKILPFRFFYKTYNALIYTNRYRSYNQAYIKNRIWSVKTVSHHAPFSVVCLPQALALKYLLRKQPGVELHVGVQRNKGNFEAHAWVESNHIILIGDTPTAFRPIWVWK